MIVGAISSHDQAAASEAMTHVAHFADRAQAAAIIIESQQSIVSALALTSLLTEVSIDEFLSSTRILVILPEDRVIRMEHVVLAQRHLSYQASSAEGGHVVVFPFASELSLPVSNAVLKLLEEMQLPSRCIFGVARQTDLLLTVQSRCIVLSDGSARQHVLPEDIDFWAGFLRAGYDERFALLEKQFSKKTKGGKAERDRLDDHIAALSTAHTTAMEAAVTTESLAQLQKQGAVIENIRQLCHTVSIQITLDSLLFL